MTKGEAIRIVSAIVQAVDAVAANDDKLILIRHDFTTSDRVAIKRLLQEVKGNGKP